MVSDLLSALEERLAPRAWEIPTELIQRIRRVREPGVIEAIEFYGIHDLALDELHDELADLFIANAPEAAGYYLGGDDDEGLRLAA